MIRSLPPVRRAVPLRRWPKARAQAYFRDLFPGYEPWLCRSGTDALAAALVLAKNRKHAETPEAIVPAYGCPDLVTACEAAGVAARLVDTAELSWSYDEAALRSAVSSKTVALLAVNLLGLGDNADRLAEVARSVGALLIQDSAQHFPDIDATPLGNAVVLSFGRGKPANAVGGGALLVGRALTAPEPCDITRAPSVRENLRDIVIGSRIFAAAFNLATLPIAYGITTRVPGLGIGETRYAALHDIAALREDAWRRIGPAVREHLRAGNALAFWNAAATHLHECGIQRPSTVSGAVATRMLRLPLLARDRLHRDRLVHALQKDGLGATAFYGIPLNQIEGIPLHVRAQGPFPNATQFAERLFTLPTHEHVTADDVQRSLHCMSAVSR